MAPLTVVYTFKVIDGRIKSDILAFTIYDYDEIIASIKLNYPDVQTIVYDAYGESVILDIANS